MKFSESKSYLDAMNFFARGELDKSRECYQECMSEASDDGQKAFILCMIARTYELCGNFLDARSLLEQAEQIDTSGVSFLTSARLLASQGEMTAAVQKCLQAISFIQKNPEAIDFDSVLIAKCRNLIDQIQGKATGTDVQERTMSKSDLDD